MICVTLVPIFIKLDCLAKWQIRYIHFENEIKNFKYHSAQKCTPNLDFLCCVCEVAKSNR